jgi:hypothetical protein
LDGNRRAGSTTKDFCDPVDGLGEAEGEIGLGRGVVGEGEGDGAKAADEGAEKDAGVTVGDAVGAVLEEGAEEEEDGGGNLGAVEGSEGAAEFEPCAERSVAVAKGGEPGLRCVMAAERGWWWRGSGSVSRWGRENGIPWETPGV